MSRLKHLLQRPMHRYVIVGGTVYLLELAVIALVQWRGGSATFAVALSFWLGLFASFALQKLATFGDWRLHRRVLLPQAAAFFALVLFNFGFTLLTTKVLSGWMPAAATRTLALAITTAWNYRLYKTHIFRVDDEVLLVD